MKWELSSVDLTSPQIVSLPQTIERAKRAHEIDVIIRKDGKETRLEADWINHLKIVDD